MPYVRIIHHASGETYGAPRVHQALHALGQDRLDTLGTNTASLRASDKVSFLFLPRYRMSWRRYYRFAEAPL